ncbi:unnamed protein product [Anisakis simplex]|uniref:Uncharacterized protein n=1 Tax=Anisakis simplex TaxID=6269 RepID=A0A0M3JB26_ANISI|nr:unnamed protein product [Anisakis simplex]VDK27854.1 unnamed protein product [Anisakis simplex]
MKFVDAAIRLIVDGGCVYSLHKTATRDFILKNASRKKGIECECIAELTWDLPATYRHHRKASLDIAVDLIRYTKSP